jgi:hypothetical protein
MVKAQCQRIQPELCLISACIDMDMRRLLIFIAIEEKSVAPYLHHCRHHRIIPGTAYTLLPAPPLTDRLIFQSSVQSGPAGFDSIFSFCDADSVLFLVQCDCINRMLDNSLVHSFFSSAASCSNAVGAGPSASRCRITSSGQQTPTNKTDRPLKRRAQSEKMALNPLTSQIRVAFLQQISRHIVLHCIFQSGHWLRVTGGTKLSEIGFGEILIAGANRFGSRNIIDFRLAA